MFTRFDKGANPVKISKMTRNMAVMANPASVLKSSELKSFRFKVYALFSNFHTTAKMNTKQNKYKKMVRVRGVNMMLLYQIGKNTHTVVQIAEIKKRLIMKCWKDSVLLAEFSCRAGNREVPINAAAPKKRMPICNSLLL